MQKIKSKKEYFYLIVSIFVLLLFFYMTYKTPLAGDDWGYALNGMYNNPFKMAMEFYNTWSGRFFSELYGFIVAPNKWLWNILNPLLFTFIFICMYKLAHVRKRYVFIPLFILACILSVDDNLRMETYTWLMGTTYVIPLLLSLVYLLIYEKLLFSEIKLDKKAQRIAILSNIILFYIGLTMENIAAIMIIITIALAIYSYYNRKSLFKYLVINIIVSSVSFIIMRMSPGSAYRLINDNSVWVNMSLIDKLISAYPSFIEYTFLNNNYLILFFSVTISLLVLSTDKNILIKIGIILVQIIASICVFGFVINVEMFINAESLFNKVFWILDIIAVIYTLFVGLKGKRQLKALFLFVIGGSFNVVMLYSPIFGSRSSLYTVFYLIIVMALILDSITINKYIILGYMLVILFVLFDRCNEYIYKYRLVGLRSIERDSIIEYYQKNPDVAQAYIPRYPIYTIHGADIESDDVYHLDTFKDYYNLSQDTIIFYFVEDN